MKRVLVVIMAVVLLFTGAESVLAENETASENKRDVEELVIVLDPGHDSTHAGAGGYGIREEKAVLKIGLYLREELNKYQNVKVYMTREGESCAFPNTIGVSEGSKRCNESRVAYAESVGADVIVALHLNSYGNSSPNGVLAFVQNNNFSPEAGKISQGLGQAIVNRIAELGLKNGGIVTKGSAADTQPEEYYYEDGSVADYYRVLRYAKKVHIPALIVEHAFLSNPSDVEKVLNSENGLKALALKDAQGIVDYYGLTLKEGCVAGELPDIQTVPETQTKPTPEPTPQPESTPAPETEQETETQIPEETETEIEPGTEDTETLIPEETQTTEDDLDDIAASGDAKEFPWGAVALVVAVIVLGGGTAAVFWWRKQKQI